MTSSICPIPETGWAAPMFVPGAMAATSAATVITKPAEAARAPEGPTKATIGVRQLSILSTIWRIDVSRPPGVSRRRTSRGACCSSACSMARTTCPAADRVDDAVEIHDGNFGAKGCCHRRRDERHEGEAPGYGHD